MPLLVSSKPLMASIVIGSFGSAQAFNAPVFEVEIKVDPNSPAPHYEKPLRYGQKPEIHHIFRDDPRSPPKVVSLFFALAVVATVPALFIGVSLHNRHCVCDTSLTNCIPVARTRREPQPPHQGHWCRSIVARLFLWIHCCNGVRIFHVLYQLDVVPNASSCGYRRCSDRPKRRQSLGRGTEQASRWRTLKFGSIVGAGRTTMQDLSTNLPASLAIGSNGAL